MISKETQNLIDRMCRNVERGDFRLQKEKAEECILKTYDLFGLSRPKNIVWFDDIMNEEWEKIAWSAWSAGSNRSAWSDRSAGSAWSNGSNRSAKSARSTWSAWSNRSAGSNGAAGSALDYNFDWFVIEHEYIKNRKDNPGEEPNENDFKYLEYSELLMEAKEYGLGYRIEWQDTLYLVPTPLVLLDEKNRFHSENKPAIRWKKGAKVYFLNGVKFEKELWKKVINKELSSKEILGLENIEQRMIAIKYKGIENMLEELGAKLLDKTERNELYLIENVFSQPAYFLKYSCPSTGRVYCKGVKPEIGKQGNADLAQANSFKWSLEEYNKISMET